MARLESLEALLARGQDGALLRFSLGGEYLQRGQAREAVAHLQQAVALDPGYSAAWKLLGRALADSGEAARACGAFEQGIEAARQRGDKQAEKEMQVFLRRLRRAQGPQAGGTSHD